MSNTTRYFAATMLGISGVLGTLLFTGCQRKETVLEVQAPGTAVEVERDKDTGKVEVDVNR